MMMRQHFPDHDDELLADAPTAEVTNDIDFHRHDSPDPRYYRNAPRYDEGHIQTSSYECSTASSASQHTPDHSPKGSSAGATTRDRTYDVEYSERADCDEGRDAAEEVTDFRGDDYHPHSVPEYGNDPHAAHAGSHGFVPTQFDAHPPPHGFHQANPYPGDHHQVYHHQPSFPHRGYEPHYHHHAYHQQDYPAQYQHDHLPLDPSYYTTAFDAPVPEHFQQAPQPPPPTGEAIYFDHYPGQSYNETGPPHAQVLGQHNSQGGSNKTGAASSAHVVQEYNDRDILCGRGALMIWHPGNQVFRRLVQTHRQRYFFSRRQEKKKIATQIMDEVRAHGGRFLRRSQSSDGLNEINVWIEIDEERAYQKTCQALREGAPEIRKQWRNKPSSRGSTKTEETKENADKNAASK